MKTLQWCITESVFNSDIFSFTKRQELSKPLEDILNMRLGAGEE